VRRVPCRASWTRSCLALACVVAVAIALPADASKTKLRLERVVSSDDGVQVYASIVELEGQVVDDRPAPTFELKVNGKNVGRATKLQRFQGSGDPLDVVLIVESSALYGPKPPSAAAPGTPPPSAPAAPPPAPTKGSKGKKGQKGAKAGAKRSAFKLDSSSSSGDQPLDKVKEAVQSLFEGMPPKWRVFFIDYGGDVTPHPPFRPAGGVGGDIDGLSADGDAADLKLIQAVDAALIELNKEAKAREAKGDKPARRLIVLVSDGLNYNMDKNAFRTLGKSASKFQIPIHTIAFSPQDDRGPLLNLGEISKLSNGTFRWAKNGDDLRNQIETLADELNKQYVLTFKYDDALENRTFVLTQADLTSNVLHLGKNVIGDKHGLGWWWLLIIAGVLAVGGIVLVVIARSHVEVHDFGAAARQKAEQQAAQAQPAAAPQQPRNAMRIGDPAPAQQQPSAARGGLSRGTVIVVGGALSNVRVGIAIGAAPILIGKGPATLQIMDDPAVSTRHALISGEPQGITLTDLQSTNGTFVNNQRISSPTLLQDGDLVRVGNTQIKFRAE
jgi:FHA domain/von Willebrand factor type A domain